MGGVASFSQIEPYILEFEGGGQNILCTLPGCPGVPNPSGAPKSTASGYFQITNSTWAGVPTSITGGTPTAMSAPFSVQANAAQWLWTTDNGSDWLGNGADYKGNANIIAANNAIEAGNPPPVPASIQALMQSNGGGVNSAVAAAGEGSTETGAAQATSGALGAFGGIGGLLTGAATGGATGPITPSPSVAGAAATAATGGAAAPAAQAAGTAPASGGIVSTILTFLSGGALNVVIAAIAVMLLAFAVWPNTKYILEKGVRA